MWNDTDTPIAYFISFRCYGTWLHGDERGSIDRQNNVYRQPYIEKNSNWKKYSESLLKSEPSILLARQRRTVECAIREVCEFRSWQLHAVTVRTNHVHVVLSCGTYSSASALNAFEACSTKHLRDQKLWAYEHSPWADEGSRRRKWNEQGLEAAIKYVVDGQGGPLPDFD